jgi:hypothetical protein
MTRPMRRTIGSMLLAASALAAPPTPTRWSTTSRARRSPRMERCSPLPRSCSTTTA